MYVTLQELTIVHPSKYRPQTGDRVAYERLLNGDRIFTITGEPSKYDSVPVKSAGILYFDTNENPVLVPNTWSDDDAWCARSFWPADGFPEDAPPADLAHYLTRLGFAIVNGQVELS